MGQQGGGERVARAIKAEHPVAGFTEAREETAVVTQCDLTDAGGGRGDTMLGECDL